MVIEVRPEQLQKAYFPILVTLLGIVIDLRLEQPSKARSPILVTLSGIVIDLRLEHLKNYTDSFYLLLTITTVQ